MALIECSECGAKISDKSDKCVKCGCPVEKRQSSESVIVSVPVFCTHCGKENKGDKSICAYCGKEIGSPPIDYCRYCGAETGIFTDQEKCKKCGKDLVSEDAEAGERETGGLMRIVLFVLAALSFISGIITSLDARTVFQQIIGGISLIISAILFSGAGIVDAINQLEKKIKEGDTGR